MPDVFLSYSRQDRKTAEHIIRELRKKGLDVFFDRDALVAGESFDAKLTDAIRSAKAVVVLLSANTGRSRYVQRDVASALESAEGKTIIPVLLDKEARENWVWPLLANRQAIDLGSGDDQDDQKVIQAVMDAFPPRRAFGSSLWLRLAVVLILMAGLVVFTWQSPSLHPDGTEAARFEIPDLLGKLVTLAVGAGIGYWFGYKRK